MHPSPKVTLPLITASKQITVFGCPPRDERPPRADVLPEVLPPAAVASPRAEVRPVVAASPRADVLPVVGAGSAPLADTRPVVLA